MRAHACICALVWLPRVTLALEMAAINPSQPSHSGARLITPEQESAWYALLFTHASVTDRIDRVLREQHGLSFSAVEILCRLHDEEPQSVRALAAQLVSVSATRASRVVQELVDAGYLQRGADQGDGRKSLISFTPAGRSHSENVARTLEDAILRYFIEPLDDEDVAAIARIWDKLRAAQAREPAAVSS
jgi:DNA-binding MarR family transcriptional regulator